MGKDYDYVGWINPDYKYALVRMGNKWGLVDEYNHIQIPIEFDEIDWPYQNRYYAVNKNGRWGVWDGLGKLIIPLNYNEIPKIGDDVITIGNLKFKNERTENGWEWVARDYSEYDKAFAVGRDYLIVNKGGKYGIITKDKKIVIPIKYEGIESFSRDRLYNVYAKRAVGVFDVDAGEWVFKPNDYIRIYYSDGRYQFVYDDFVYERRAWNADKYDWIKELFTNPEKYR